MNCKNRLPYSHNNSQFSQIGGHPQNQNNNFHQNQPPPPKRANKRRFRHDVPGPAGAWFRLRKQNNKRKSNNERTTEERVIKSDEPDEITSSTNAKSNSQQASKNKTSVQLFKDYSSTLHDCNAWNLMCLSHERIVPSFDRLSLTYDVDNDKDNAASLYKALLRSIVPQNQSLIHEIHTGQWDVHHISPSIHTNDLRIPLLFGYVSTISCHAHSDWTAVLVDESYSCGGGKGVMCWLEEKLVKRHPAWIRPGVVWMLEGAKLALFASKEECDELPDDEGGTNDISPSTDAARGGYAIDRMILVGDASLVYAWTPEEASEHFSDSDFIELLERRSVVDLSGENPVKNSGQDAALATKSKVWQKSMKASRNPVSAFNDESVQIIDSEERQISPVISRIDASNLENARQPTEPQKNSTKNAVGSSNVESTLNNQQTNGYVRRKISPEVSKTDDKVNCAESSSDAANATKPGQAFSATTTNSSKSCTVARSEQKASCQQLVLECNTDSVTGRNVSIYTVQNNRQHGKSTPPTSCTPTVQPMISDVSCKDSSGSKKSNKPCREDAGSITPKTSTTHRPLTSTRSQCPLTGDSLIVDDDQLFNTSNKPNAEYRENSGTCEQVAMIVENMRMNPGPPTLPPFETATNTTLSTSKDLSKINGIECTPKRSVNNEILASMPIQCPPTGDSFDDSLDIDDDELFNTGNNVQRSVTCQPPAALNIPVNTSESLADAGRPDIQSVDLAPAPTTTKTPVLPSGPFFFCNLDDDDDLDSLVEEDDL
jgi:hypothetical protein